MTRRMSASQADHSPDRLPGLPMSDGLGLIAHDIRSALSVVRGFATTLELLWDRLDDDKIQAALGMIAARADELVAFADELVDMSRAEEGRLELHSEALCISSLIADAARRASVDHPGHTFSTRLPRGLTLEGDRRRLGQVVANLLDNAAKNAPSGTVVEIEAKTAMGNAVVTVTNTGAGITDSLKPHLFQKFVPAGARRPGGTGLGLYLCRLIVELHNGRIWAEDGGGRTSFRFALPLPVIGGDRSV